MLPPGHTLSSDLLITLYFLTLAIGDDVLGHPGQGDPSRVPQILSGSDGDFR